MEYLKRTWAEIDIDALLHNFNLIKGNSNRDICAVVKADAYGHGAEMVSKALSQAGTDMFAVSNIDEAVSLRSFGITKPILILGYTPEQYVDELLRYDIIQTVYALSYAEKLSLTAQSQNGKIKCHIKIDTGMSRLGFDCRSANLEGISEILAVTKLGGLEIDGIFTHFATADFDNDPNGKFAAEQYSRFVATCTELENAGVYLKTKHCCNSAGMLFHDEKATSLARPGIILYGLTPSADLKLPLPLKPVMTFKSTVSFVKKIKKGDTVSYGRKFEAEKDMTVATVPVGYADGYPRALSNKASVLINGERARVLGNVCMDQIVVDVTEIDDVREGSTVVLFGETLPVEEIASLCNTINYEIVCGISRRVPRVYIKNGKEVEVIDYILD